MGTIGTLNTFVAGTTIVASQMNDNFSDIRTAFNTFAVLTDTAATITVAHTINPTVAGAPFVLGVNAQGQLVTGLNADQLDSQEGAFYRDAGNLNAGTLLDARVAASNVTQHQAALSIAASQLTGTLPDARVAESNVTQHQAAITLTAGQIPSHGHDGGDITTGTVPAARLPTNVVFEDSGSIFGSRGGNVALASLLTHLEGLNLLTDATTA